MLSSNFRVTHENMINEQLIARGIGDEEVLSAFRKVLRHEYVLPRYMEEAYSDSPLPIEAEQTISQPYIVALMMELLHLKNTDKVLEIGTGSGYLTALLAEMVQVVISIECVKVLHHKAKKKLLSKYSNVVCILDNGVKGYSSHAPYDKIIVSAATPKMLKVWIDQLNVGGLIVAPIGSIYQKLILIQKIQNQNGKIKIKETPICGVRFVPLV